MYLINVKTMKLEYFQDDRNLVYAILSHRWCEEEVLFEDMQKGTAQSRAGYNKLDRFCIEASAANYDYAWCDTCCIDKSSSAELSESINSMFRWYKNSAVCFAYLFDVTASKADDDSDFGNSSWFTRGWCLQELLASPSIIFYNRDWRIIGNKKELSQAISKTTNIPHEALCGISLSEFSIAQRMSWASKRITTRIEDLAYSLIGIFGVNMPLLYGEGERAFLRLQEEIMRKSKDQSIFAHSSRTEVQGLLATSPADFQDSSEIEKSDQMITGEPYSITNMGLSIDLLVFPWSMDVYLAHLDCKEKDSDNPIAIFLMLQGTNDTDHAIRIKFNGNAWTHNADVIKLPWVKKRLYIELDPPQPGQIEQKRYGFWMRECKGRGPLAKDSSIQALCWNDWDGDKRILEIPDGKYGTAGVVILEEQGYQIPIRIGFTIDFEPVIEVLGRLPYEVTIESGPVRIFGPKDIVFKKSGERCINIPSLDVEVLSNISWVTNRNGETGIFVKGRNRELPISKGPIWLGSRAYKFQCQKLLVEGVRTWVVDIAWSKDEDYVYQNWSMRQQSRIICDGCKQHIQTIRYKCTVCTDFDFCSDCINSAKSTHNPTHEFGEHELPVYWI